ncbi:Ribosome maturation protein SDO1 [Wickerhamiella sorbophila]|uniref:Ribosome maturation protein SDO1 n=1 Tax=Wickerhamiella sorbophila TaxID=45607 RepID=A0A2T0FE40_9ASCO|nr:Ribosome maturation protein SDO1 [Wickerhamiella sorbophila]PRT53264.1 Ribosome maturation protein SDO1 [Wickerhamiella sorbophila]
MVISQPLGSIKLTNVSQVRMRKGKRRYEVVCYRNKVQDWRRGVEKDIDEVLQIPQVFVNAAKGEVANGSDLKEDFGTSDVNEVVLEILNKGELQVGSKERQLQQEQVQATVLEEVARKCVNPRNNYPYTVSIIQKLLQELDFKFSSTKPAKGQALEAIKLLVERQVIPIARARMQIRVSDDAQHAKEYWEEVTELVDVESENWDTEWELVGKIDPSDFRTIDRLVSEKSHGLGFVDVVSLDY